MKAKLGQAAMCVTQVLLAAVLSSAAFVGSFWIPALFIEQDEGGSRPIASLVFNAMVVLTYIFITMVSERRPGLLAKKGLTAASVVLVEVSCLVWLLLGGNLGVVCYALMGAIYILGSYWLNIAAVLSLGNIPGPLFLLGVSAAYPIARIMTSWLVGFPQSVYVAVAMVGALLVGVLVLARFPKVLIEAGASVPPHDLRVANAGSFLPFTSHFFVELLLVALLLSAISVAGVGVAPIGVSPLAACTPVIVIACLIIGKGRTSASTLSSVAVVLAFGGALCCLTFGGGPGSVPSDLAGCGVGTIELVLYWYSIFVLAGRNPLSSLPTLAWGRAALALGTLFGSALELANASIGSVLGVPAETVTLGVTTLVFAGFCAVELKGFGLDRLAAEVSPLSPAVASGGASDSARQGSAGVGMTEAADLILQSRYQLTHREVEVFWLLARGRDYHRIAGELGLKLNTVKSHVRSIYAKTSVHSQQELIDLSEVLLKR